MTSIHCHTLPVRPSGPSTSTVDSGSRNRGSDEHSKITKSFVHLRHAELPRTAFPGFTDCWTLDKPAIVAVRTTTKRRVPPMKSTKTAALAFEGLPRASTLAATETRQEPISWSGSGDRYLRLWIIVPRDSRKRSDVTERFDQRQDFPILVGSP